MTSEIIITKQCKNCRETKPLDGYYKDTRGKYGRYANCKLCHNKVTKTHAKNNPDKIRQYRLQYDYGMTPEDYDALYLQQEGACGICDEYSSKALRVDHDHISGKVRGLLCVGCNIAIGLLKENPRLFISAMSYLEKHDV